MSLLKLLEAKAFNARLEAFHVPSFSWQESKVKRKVAGRARRSLLIY